MIEIAIPGFGQFRLQHLVSEYNGTLALDGRRLPSVAGALRALTARMAIYVITADTFSRAATELAGLPMTLHRTPADSQDLANLDYLQRLNPKLVSAFGNGRNDRLLLKEAALGIVLLEWEGAAAETLVGTDMVIAKVLDAFELLKNPQRLIATLRI